MFTKLKIRLLSYGYHTVMLRLYYGKCPKRYRKRSGNGSRMERSDGHGWAERVRRMGTKEREDIAAN